MDRYGGAAFVSVGRRLVGRICADHFRDAEDARGSRSHCRPGKTYLTIGFSELGRTFRELARLRIHAQVSHWLPVLQRRDSDSDQHGLSVFMAQELFIARGLKTDQSFLLVIFLMVQFVAIFGALVF